MFRALTLLSFVLFSASIAQAQPLQFDASTPPTAPTAAPTAPITNGVQWLQQQPMTLFDLGMMELTNAANKLIDTTPEIAGAVAEFQSEKNIIAISFYANAPYTEQSCLYLAQKMRGGLFSNRTDTDALARELGSYFISYGTPNPTRPRSIGRELITITRIAIYMPGGACQLPLQTDEAIYDKDPNYTPPAVTSMDDIPTAKPAVQQPKAHP